jgi:hypothetical protein
MGEQASWAYWTAKELGLELVNLAIGGMANDWIYSKPILWFNKNKDKINQSICMVAWSDFGRQHTIYQPVIETKENSRWVTNISPGDLGDTPPYDPSNEEVPMALKFMHENRNGLKPYFGSIIDSLNKTVESQLILREYLETANIPFSFFDAVTLNKFKLNNNKIEMLNPDDSPLIIDFPNETIMKDESSLLNNEISSYLYDSHYFDFEGQSIWGCYPRWENGSEKYEKGNFGHTNIDGAKIFAKLIVDKFKNLYNIQ